MMAVEAVKENFYCFLGIVHPTYYQSRGWGTWLMPYTSKTDEFSEKFQTAFDHPSFSESYVAIFSEIHDRSIVYNGKNLQHKFLDFSENSSVFEG